MNLFRSDLIARAIQKQDKSRVALRRSSCGAVLIDGLQFAASIESDGARSDKGLVFTLSGEAVADGRFSVDMLDVTYPAAGGGKSIKRKVQSAKTKEGKKILRCVFDEIKIPECADPDSLAMTALTEEQLKSSTPKQIIFRFTPHYTSSEEAEIMLNIYPKANPLDGSFTEWLTATNDREFFEHGGLVRLTESKAKKGKKLK